MEFQFPAINYLYLLACVLALVLSYISNKQRGDRASRYWVLVLLSFAIWTAAELIANIGTTLEWQLAFQRLVYLGVILGVVSWVMFAIHFSGNARWLTPIVVTAMLIVPAGTLVLVASLESHTLFYKEVALIYRDSYYVLDLRYGVGFWVQLIFCSYLYTLAGSVLLIAKSVQQPSLYRNQSLLIVIAAAIPLVANILYVLGVDFAGGFDPTPLFFVFSAVLITIATRNYFFLRLAPIARDLVFRNIDSGVLVVNEALQVTDVNPAFAEIGQVSVDEFIGKELKEVLETTFDTSAMHIVEQRYSGRLLARQRARQFELSSMDIKGYRGERLGLLLMLSDVTQIQRAIDEIRRLAHTDLLTELPNRRALVEWVEDLSGIDSMFTPVIIAMADLDYFKALNDTHGHHCGDYILKEVAALIGARLGRGDIVARWGGEEFCLVLTGHSWEQGENLIEQLRQKIESHVFFYEGHEIQVTMTFGVVQRLPGEELELAIKRADLMMYDGKRHGRNRVSSGSTRSMVQ